MTIDMKDYAGELSDSAAESQPIDLNSYANETQHEEYPVYKELLDEVKNSNTETALPEEAVPEPQLSKQELNFKALREEIDRIKSERESERSELKQQIDLLRANQVQQLQENSSSSRPKMFEGLNDDDIPSVKDIENAWSRRESEYQSRIEEMQVMQQHSDYNEVLEKYLSPLIKQDPTLAEGLKGASNKALFAYKLGKMAQMQQQVISKAPENEPPKVNPMAQRIVENARKPGSLSNAGGQGGLSKADYYASMSDREFLDLAGRYLGEI